MPRLKQFILLFFILLFSVGSYAGVVKGTVIDKQTGEPLVGAVVTLQNTTYGAVAGLDGSYTIKGVPAGDYQLKIQYTSYVAWTKHITLTDGQELKVNVKLAEKTSMLKEVTVKGKFKNGSENQARSMEKNASEIKNIMSARTIELLPDITVANVLQRVSGVQVQRSASGEARYATIRGMDKRYNYTEVNGIKIPSPDDKARYVPMDLFPAEILDRLEVIKSLTPNMEADAVGGVMNMVLKDAPDKFVLYASGATGYNQQNFDRSYTYFDRKGIINNDPYKTYGPQYNAKPSDFQNNTLHYNTMQAKPNDLFSLTIGDRFLKHKQLGVIFSGSYQNTFKNTNSMFCKPSLMPDKGNVPAITDFDIYNYSIQETRTALHTKIDYDLNPRNKFSLYGLFVQLDKIDYRSIVDTTVQINRTGAGNGPVDISYRSEFLRQRIANVTFQGKHYFTDKLYADYSLAYSKAWRFRPDMTTLALSRGVDHINSEGQAVWKPVLLNNIKHEWETTTDQDLSGFLNLHYYTHLFGTDFNFSGGGMYRHKYRDNRYNGYILDPANATQPYTNIDSAQVTVLTPQGKLPYNGLTYNIVENVSAYYLMTTFHLFPKLEVIGGVRAENTYQHYNLAEDPSSFEGQNGTFQYTDILPDIHFKYALNSKQNLRLSYFSSINRPQFTEILPNVIRGEYFNWGGNPYIRHTTANNFDFRYEWFPKGLDQLLAGAFYKVIHNPIEYSLAPDGSGASAYKLMPVNAIANATNYGIELQLTKYIHSFGISANYTYTHSKVKDSILSRDATPNGVVNDRITYTRPLESQSSSVANVALIYKAPKIGFDAHFTWVYTGPQIAYLSNYVDLNYWQRATSLFDFSLEKRIKKHFYIYAKVNNLFNTPIILELKYPKETFVSKDNSYQLADQNLPNLKVKAEYFSRNYLIGIRYKID